MPKTKTKFRKPRVAKPPEQTNREMTLKILERLLGYRATTFADRLRDDMVTVEEEAGFDRTLLGCAALLGVGFEVWDTRRGTVELYACGASVKRRRFMKPREWARCHELPKIETLQFIDAIPSDIVERVKADSAKERDGRLHFRRPTRNH